MSQEESGQPKSWESAGSWLGAKSGRASQAVNLAVQHPVASEWIWSVAVAVKPGELWFLGRQLWLSQAIGQRSGAFSTAALDYRH